MEIPKKCHKELQEKSQEKNVEPQMNLSEESRKKFVEIMVSGKYQKIVYKEFYKKKKWFRILN